ncbi:hypothetical protein GIB67_009117 [Kingdonia uniflora]|uniref:Pentatricopeptide repeat-containing protein n=1 Tax=Kingdonia uniflora TaxID=39325 RepID=A0A7J7N2G6_9MAGN|nr:hypothetical protein GIB67_009117 [Kingdonia uniflora]
MYTQSGDILSLELVFEGIVDRNIVSWTAIVAGPGFSKFWEIDSWRDTRDLVSWNAMIVAYEQSGFITNALIDMYAKCGNIDLAKGIFQKLPKKSVVSWTAVIRACGNHGHGKVTLELFSNTVEEGVRPNMFTFTAVLTTCRHSGLLEEVDLLGRAGLLVEAYEFIKWMPVKPDDCVWGALLGACRVHGNLEFVELVAEHLFS